MHAASWNDDYCVTIKDGGKNEPVRVYNTIGLNSKYSQHFDDDDEYYGEDDAGGCYCDDPGECPGNCYERWA